jgi:ATP-dependent helicase/nuclease subunit B
MAADRPRIYSIPVGIAFADALARGLRQSAGDDPLALAAMTVLVPTRRAVRALTDAFLRVTEGQALLLPRLLALADLDGDQDALAIGDLPAAIDPLRRRLILARLAMSRGGEFSVSPDQALRLAEPLAELIDEVETEQVDFARLADLAPEAFAGHWQATIEFLRIVTAHWPAILEQQGVVDPARRRVLALAARAAQWQAHPPADPVIAAGFIAADPALTRLIGVVSRLPAGCLVLPGLDLDLDNEGWDSIAATHPQWGMKAMLGGIGVERATVSLWPAVRESDLAAGLPRARLLGEALRPAQTTAQWRTGPPIDPLACAGLTRIDCGTIGEEAEVIALAMREALETPARTAALVTPDRGLARRVAAALGRWGIAIDDSAGRPLSETPVGVWLGLVAEAAIADFPPRLLLAMLKHPFAAGGVSPETMRHNVRLLERLVLRGPRPGAGLEGIRAALADTPLKNFDGDALAKQALLDWIDDLTLRFAPMANIVRTGGGSLDELLMRHAEVAESLADTPGEAGGLRLWRGQDGEAAAALFAGLGQEADLAMPPIRADRYPAVLSALMSGITVRPLYGAHPRLAIWGLIEARLQRADLMILGGLNEGSWPPLPGDEPWMSRPMRERFGLPPLEARIGGAAQDFALAAAGPEILLTRAERVDGAPTVPARFLSRLETLLKGSGLSLPRQSASVRRAWAEALDRPERVTPWLRPNPCPPLAARPRRLSVTAIETWMRDPYALYAGRILRLLPLDPLDADPGAAERGQIVHHALDAFVRRYPDRLPADALAALVEEGRAAFGAVLAHPSVAAFWWPRFERVAAWFVEFETGRRRDGARPLATEISGGIDIETAGAPFRLTAKADRIDRLPDGRLAIVDYKTGRPPEPRNVRRGLAPQLPLEAVIAEQGGFPGVPMGEIAELAYLRLSGGNPPGMFMPALGREPPAQAIADAWMGLVGLIEAFDNPAKPYSAIVRPEFAFAGDYDHLSRLDEWAAGS